MVFIAQLLRDSENHTKKPSQTFHLTTFMKIFSLLPQNLTSLHPHPCYDRFRGKGCSSLTKRKSAGKCFSFSSSFSSGPCLCLKKIKEHCIHKLSCNKQQFQNRWRWLFLTAWSGVLRFHRYLVIFSDISNGLWRFFQSSLQTTNKNTQSGFPVTVITSSKNHVNFTQWWTLSNLLPFKLSGTVFSFV